MPACWFLLSLCRWFQQALCSDATPSPRLGSSLVELERRGSETFLRPDVFKSPDYQAFLRPGESGSPQDDGPLAVSITSTGNELQSKASTIRETISKMMSAGGSDVDPRQASALTATMVQANNLKPFNGQEMVPQWQTVLNMLTPVLKSVNGGLTAENTRGGKRDEISKAAASVQQEARRIMQNAKETEMKLKMITQENENYKVYTEKMKDENSEMSTALQRGVSALSIQDSAESDKLQEIVAGREGINKLDPAAESSSMPSDAPLRNNAEVLQTEDEPLEEESSREKPKPKRSWWRR